MAGEREMSEFTKQRRSVIREGLNWLLDDRQSIDQSILKYGIYEAESTAAVKRLVRPGMTCLDVGANIGYYTLLMASLVGTEGTVLAFEPTEAFDVLADHIRINPGLASIIPYRVALGGEERTQDLSINYSWPPSAADPVRPTPTKIRSLDDFQLSQVDFIKVDTDGWELEFLQGAVYTLTGLLPPMLIEIYGYTLCQVSGLPREQSNATAMDLLTKLQELGYKLHWLSGEPIGNPQEVLNRDDMTCRSSNVLALSS